MGTGVVLHDMIDALLGEGGVEGVRVNLQRLVCVLHPIRWLKILSLSETRPALVVPCLDVLVVRLELLVVGRDAVREAEVFHVADVIVVAHRASLGDPVDHTIILEEGANTEVLRVTEQHFAVFGGPSDARCFAKPTDASPEINSPFYTSFLAFVALDLNNNTSNNSGK